jgi:hypothetical protein
MKNRYLLIGMVVTLLSIASVSQGAVRFSIEVGPSRSHYYSPRAQYVPRYYSYHPRGHRHYQRYEVRRYVRPVVVYPYYYEYAPRYDPYCR